MVTTKKATGKLRWLVFRDTNHLKLGKVLQQEIVVYQEMGNTQLYIETVWEAIEEVEAPNEPEKQSL